jgi:hypothetical protein
MKPFPWGLLTLILFVLDLLMTGFILIRKHVAKWLCRRALAQGKQAAVNNFLSIARTYCLLKASEEITWRKEFGLEDLNGIRQGSSPC